jgi:hypothetical protein
LTVWKWRRLLRSDRFRSASVSNGRLCVARSRSGFQIRSAALTCGL